MIKRDNIILNRLDELKKIKIIVKDMKYPDMSMQFAIEFWEKGVTDSNPKMCTESARALMERAADIQDGYNRIIEETKIDKCGSLTMEEHRILKLLNTVNPNIRELLTIDP